MRDPKTGFVLLLTTLCLMGCAGRMAESMMLTADTALITAIGAKPGDKDRVVQASLKEAARLTREQGYQYFVVLDSADASRKGRTIQAGGGRLRQEKINDNPFGNSNLPSLTSVYGTFPPAGESVTYVKPGLDITIRMYREGAIDPGQEGVWRSDSLPGGAAR